MVEEFVGGDPRQKAQFTDADRRRTRSTFGEWGFKVGYIGLFVVLAVLTVSLVQDLPYGPTDLRDPMAYLNWFFRSTHWTDKVRSVVEPGLGGSPIIPRMLILTWIGLTGKLYFPLFALLNVFWLALPCYLLDKFGFAKSRPWVLLIAGLMIAVAVGEGDTSAGQMLYLFGFKDGLALAFVIGSLALAWRLEHTRQLWKPFFLAIAALITADFGLLAFAGAPILFTIGKPGKWRKLGLWVVVTCLLIQGLDILQFDFFPDAAPFNLPFSQPSYVANTGFASILLPGLVVPFYLFWLWKGGYRESPVGTVLMPLLVVACVLYVPPGDGLLNLTSRGDMVIALISACLLYMLTRLIERTGLMWPNWALAALLGIWKFVLIFLLFSEMPPDARLHYKQIRNELATGIGISTDNLAKGVDMRDVHVIVERARKYGYYDYTQHLNP